LLFHYYYFDISSSSPAVDGDEDDDVSPLGVGEFFIDMDEADEGVSADDADVIVDADELCFSFAFRRFFIMIRLLFSMVRPSIFY
jgi:hypothetical protein